MSVLVSRVNADPRVARMTIEHGYADVVGEIPVLATPAALAAAGAWVTANKAAAAGATAFGALFGAGVWVGVANAS